MTERGLLRRIVVEPKIMLGKPVIKGTRLPVEIIFEKVAYGATTGDLKKRLSLSERGRHTGSHLVCSETDCQRRNLRRLI